MKAGDVIQVEALKFDGKPYRWWRSTVESVSADYVTTVNRIGDVVEDTEMGWIGRHNLRNFYWFGRPYNLMEVYERSGRLRQLYVHIASPPRVEGDTLVYVDYELDVSWRPGEAPRVRDQDEFAVAAEKYGYSPEFQEACWRAVDEALGLVGSWRARGIRHLQRSRA